jgi:hypothetical protein
MAMSKAGPGQPPNPWLVNGGTVSVEGSVCVPAEVPGGSMGAGTINAEGIFVNGEAVLIGAAVGVLSFNGRTGEIVLNSVDITEAGGAVLASPIFTGTPEAPTAAPGTNTTQLATTAFVEAAVGSAVAGVSSFNTRTGDIILTIADITGAGGAPIDSPVFTGLPAAPTAAPGDNSTQIATTAFVAAAILAAGGGGGGAGVSSFNGRTGVVTFLGADITAAGGALLASPAFSGNPTAPTAGPGTNTTQLATTAFVATAISGITGGYAPLASPVFTGTPAAPTPSPGNNTNQLATTAFVSNALSGSTSGGLGSNRVDNGDMSIDQRYNGASNHNTTSGFYAVDRWFIFGTSSNKLTIGRNLGGFPSLLGFEYYIGMTSSSAYTIPSSGSFSLSEGIEADAIGDFMWGTANAQAATLSFWIISSLTGTFSGVISNYGQTRCFIFTYSIPTANTWTKITVLIPGDTSGSWVMSGSAGSVAITFDLGTGTSGRTSTINTWMNGNFVGQTGSVSLVATSGAKLGITGVKLELGSVATAFNVEPLSTRWNRCLRHFQILMNAGAYGSGYGGYIISSTTFQQMRVAPSVSLPSPSYSNASNLAVQDAEVNEIVFGANSSGSSYAWGICDALLSADL